MVCTFVAASSDRKREVAYCRKDGADFDEVRRKGEEVESSKGCGVEAVTALEGPAAEVELAGRRSEMETSNLFVDLSLRSKRQVQRPPRA